MYMAKKMLVQIKEESLNSSTVLKGFESKKHYWFSVTLLIYSAQMSQLGLLSITWRLRGTFWMTPNSLSGTTAVSHRIWSKRSQWCCSGLQFTLSAPEDRQGAASASQLCASRKIDWVRFSLYLLHFAWSDINKQDCLSAADSFIETIAPGAHVKLSEAYCGLSTLAEHK